MSEITPGADMTHRKQGLFFKLMLRSSGVSLFEGGEIPNTDGIIRVVSAHSSAYLVPTNTEKTDYVLIDAGMDKNAANIKKELQIRALHDQAIKAIFITHGHPDHIGGLRQFPDVPIYVGAPDDGYVSGKAPSDGFVGKLTGSQPGIAVTDPDQLKTIADGQVVSIGEKSVEAFTIPGHTRGSVAYVIGSALFVGDAIAFRRNGTKMDSPKPFSHDIPQSRESVARLVRQFDDQGRTIAHVIPSHSDVGTFDALRDDVRQAPMS